MILGFCCSYLTLCSKLIFKNNLSRYSFCLVEKKIHTLFDFPGLLINYLFQKAVLSRAPLNTDYPRSCEHGVQVFLHHEPEIVIIGILCHCQGSYSNQSKVNFQWSPKTFYKKNLKNCNSFRRCNSFH